MAKALLRSLSRASSLRKLSSPNPNFLRPVFPVQESIFRPSKQSSEGEPWWGLRNLSHGSVRLVISEGKAKFETREVDPPKKEKWKTKKRLKLQRMREKQKRKAANKTDPRRLGKKKRKQRFASVEERIKYKLEKAKIKEALLIERLKRYEVPKVQGPIVEPIKLTGEERFFLKKIAQKKSNYVPIGRRGVFGGVILNMHMHWKKHETVKVICNSCKPGQIHEYAQEIARLSGGIPVQIIGNDTVIFYRGKGYVQPEIMSPIDTLSKKRALEKSKYEQSLESVRQFMAVAEKELELYYRHIALYGDPNERNAVSTVDSGARKVSEQPDKAGESEKEENVCLSTGVIEMEANSAEIELSETDDDSDCLANESLSTTELDSEGDSHFHCDSDYEESSSNTEESSTPLAQYSTSVKKFVSENQRFPLNTKVL